jgi:hypothetical protein
MRVEFQRGKMLLTAENYLEGAFMRDEMGVKSGSTTLYVTGDASSYYFTLTTKPVDDPWAGRREPEV